MNKYAFVMENGMEFLLEKDIVDLYLKTLNKLSDKQYKKYKYDSIPCIRIFIPSENRRRGMQGVQWAEMNIFPDGSGSVYYSYGYVDQSPIQVSDTMGFDVENKTVYFLSLQDEEAEIKSRLGW